MSSTRSWCNRILEALLAAGVTDLVVSPGSRSTPLLLAALDSPLRLHSVIDERSAAFFALGRSRATGAPTALLCTSGSAAAHYLPAFLEAKYTAQVLIALSADRPPELQDCGANQTIDQRQLLAAACPPCLELGMPDSNPQALAGVRRRVYEAVSLAVGPLHINLPFRKPLEPTPADASDSIEKFSPPNLHRPSFHVSTECVESVQAHCKRAKAILIVAGPSETSPTQTQALATILVRLAEATGAVLLAESTSGVRFNGLAHPQRFDAYPHVLANESAARELAPDLILQFGAEPSGGALNRWLARQSCPVVRFSESRALNDVKGNAELVIGDVSDSLTRICEKLSPPSATLYVDRWRPWNRLAEEASREALESGSSPFSEAHAISHALQHLPCGTQLTMGNSLIIRTADLVLSGKENSLNILHQRGTSGIDGLIAGTIGSHRGPLSALLIGDVSASHDNASLAMAAMISGPLLILCIDNGGGQIFSHLPVHQQELSEQHWQHWQTPPELDWKSLCQAHHVEYRSATNRLEWEKNLSWACSQQACVFLHANVAPQGLSDFQSIVSRAIDRAST